MKPTDVKKIKLLAFGFVLLAGLLLVAVNFTDTFALEQVEVDGSTLDQWDREYAVLNHRPLGSQPIDSLAKLLLARKSVHKIEVELKLPSTVSIETNRFEPLCFVVDRATGRTLALDRVARVIPIDDKNTDWERPVITGIITGKAYGRCKDARIPAVLQQIERLQNENSDLFRLIDEIDMSERAYFTVSVAGLDYKLLVRGSELVNDLGHFAEFVTRFAPDMEGTAYLDFRNEGMIVRRNKKG